MLLGAELSLLLARSRDAVVLAKSHKQRTVEEAHEASHGLGRALLVEAVILVPASALLFALITPTILLGTLAERLNPTTTYALLGVASYGFPFAAVRGLVRRVALNTLREFAALGPVPHEQREVVRGGT